MTRKKKPHKHSSTRGHVGTPLVEPRFKQARDAVVVTTDGEISIHAYPDRNYKLSIATKKKSATTTLNHNAVCKLIEQLATLASSGGGQQYEHE